MAIFLETLTNIATLEHLWINQRLIYNIDGNVVGRIETNNIDEHLVNVDVIAIYPEYRKQGLFRDIIRLITRAADINGDTLTLTPMATESQEIPASTISNRKLREIYQEFGFTTDHPDAPISDFIREPVSK